MKTILNITFPPPSRALWLCVFISLFLGACGGGDGSDTDHPNASPQALRRTPAAPSGVSAVAGNGEVSLSWTASSRASSYNVKRALSSGGPYLLIKSRLTATTFSNTGLTNGTTYFYVVSAVNYTGESPNSAQASATPSAPATYALSIAVAGSGTVVSNVGAINCSASCSAVYASGTSVTLTATPAAGATFSGWGGSCAGTGATCTLSMTAARSVGAAFSSGPAPTRWQPALTDRWQWQLSGAVLNTTYNVDVYGIDLFDTPASTIQALKASGKKVVCYFSAGSSEDWRPDFNGFLPADMGNDLDGWAGERWLDTRSSNVRQIMRDRMSLAVSKGCNGIDPDNVDGYTNNSGLPLTSATQLDYNRFLAQEAHQRNLAIGLKNAVDLLGQLMPDFDFAVNEQCHVYSECDGYDVFIAAGKPVFNAEYKSEYVNNTNSARDALCADARAHNMRTLVVPLMLDGSFRYSCDP